MSMTVGEDGLVVGVVVDGSTHPGPGVGTGGLLDLSDESGSNRSAGRVP